MFNLLDIYIDPENCYKILEKLYIFIRDMPKNDNKLNKEFNHIRSFIEYQNDNSKFLIKENKNVYIFCKLIRFIKNNYP